MTDLDKSLYKMHSQIKIYSNDSPGPGFYHNRRAEKIPGSETYVAPVGLHATFSITVFAECPTPSPGPCTALRSDVGDKRHQAHTEV